EYKIAGLDANIADFDRATIIHHLSANRRILRESPARKDWPILLKHLRRVAMESVDHRTMRAAFLCGCGQNLAPVCAAHRPAAGEIDVARLELIERFSQLS